MTPVPIAANAPEAACFDAVHAVWREQLRQLAAARMLVGTAPPQPFTARGRVGAVLVRAVRRALFWFVPQLDLFHGSVVAIAQSQLQAAEALATVHKQLAEDLGRLRDDFARIGTNGATLTDLRGEMQPFASNLAEFGRLLHDVAIRCNEAESRIEETVFNRVRVTQQVWEERYLRMDAERWVACVKCRAGFEETAAVGNSTVVRSSAG